MADEEHLTIIKQGVEVWNAWVEKDVGFQANLKGANLKGHNLKGAKLSWADLKEADLQDTNLIGIDLSGADLRDANLSRASLQDAYLSYAGEVFRIPKPGTRGRADFSRAYPKAADIRRADLSMAFLERANLRGVDLEEANLSEAHLKKADLSRANLCRTSLRGANLGGADFSEARLCSADLVEANIYDTIFGDTDLTDIEGVENCYHRGPSIVDHRTLARSRNVPPGFWRGCGLPDALIDYMPSLTGDAIQFYSCFISYSSKDQEFADRLYADLQSKGVRCWFAPHDLPIGAKTWDGIDQAIRTRDKVLLILSEGALASDWVEDEVTTAFAEERRRKELVLFPVRLDGAVMETGEPWAGKLRDNRNIGDFSQWKDHDAYKVTLDRVLRDLKAKR